MGDLKELEKEIRIKLAFATERRQAAQESSGRTTDEREQRRDAYQSAARHLMASVIRPRIEKVLAFFPNALLAPPEANTESQWCCRFQKTAEFPASTKLSFLVSADTALENAIVTYDLEILPIYFKFQGHDQLVVPIATVREGKVADWVDTKLLDFVDVYLQSQTLEQYQRSFERDEAAHAVPATRG
jgi:hypothetical protein